jgi:AraC-like DNA-binding protein
MDKPLIAFEDRPSDLNVIDRVWRSHSERAGTFRSMATCNWGIVVTHCRGDIGLTVRGPETRATIADCPAEGEWFGIQFKLGTFMPLLPTGTLRDRNDVTLATASSRSFWLNGSAWEYPSFENAETFVLRLLKKGLIVADPYVDAALSGAPQLRSQRTEQRRFLRATGLTPTTIRQIERARRATQLLRDGVGILETAHDLSYFDQAHLTRSLTHFIGQTPRQIARRDAQLSLLYKNEDA